MMLPVPQPAVLFQRPRAIRLAGWEIAEFLDYPSLENPFLVATPDELRGSNLSLSVDFYSAQPSSGSSSWRGTRNQLGYRGTFLLPERYPLNWFSDCWVVGKQSILYMTDKRIVLTTASSEEEARKIARHLVERRLAACVNIVPQVASIYRWHGKIEETREWLLIVKITAAAFAQVRAAIAELHSYELPECICLTIEDGSPSYLQWIAESVSAGDSSE